MIHITFTFVLSLFSLTGTLPQSPSEPPPWKYVVHLITIGPGSSLVERFGHTLIAVGRVQPGRVENVVYNLGDSDADLYNVGWGILQGRAQFRVARMGTLSRVVSYYSARNRSVYVQQLNLTEAQIVKLRTLLQKQTVPGSQAYAFHPLRSNCATQARDLLDTITQGAIRRQLDQTRGSITTRELSRHAVAGDMGGELYLDLFWGRLFDRPLDRYQALAYPLRLKDELASIRLPNLKTDHPLPLAAPQQLLYQRKGPDPAQGSGGATVQFVCLYLLGLVVLAILAWNRTPLHPQLAGLWLLVGPILTCGLLGFLFVFLFLSSAPPEVRYNELIFSYPASDLLLLAPALFWIKGKKRLLRFVYLYSWARIVGIALVLAGMGGGYLSQQPRILVVPGSIIAILLWVLVRKIGRETANQT